MAKHGTFESLRTSFTTERVLYGGLRINNEHDLDYLQDKQIQ